MMFRSASGRSGWCLRLVLVLVLATTATPLLLRTIATARRSLGCQSRVLLRVPPRERRTRSRRLTMTPTTAPTDTASSFEDDDDDEARPLVSNDNYNDIRIHHTAIKTRNMTMALQFYSLLGLEATTKFRAGPAKAAWLQPRPQQPQRRQPRRRREDDSTTNEEEEDDGPRGGSSSSMSSSSSSSSNFLLELIEIPSFLLEEEESNLPPTARPTTPKKAPDLLKHATVLGLNHIALDVTSSIRQSLEESKKKNGDASSGKDGDAAAAAVVVVGGGGGTKKGSLLSAWLEELNQQSVDRFGKTLRVAVKPYQTMIGNGVYELAFLYDADGTLIELLYKQTELSQDIGSGWDPTERIEFQQ